MLAGRLFCLLHGLSPLPQLSNILRRKTKKDFRFCHVIYKKKTKKKNTRYFIIFLIICALCWLTTHTAYIKLVFI